MFFPKLTVIGIVSKVVIQAFLNIAVVTNLIPNTGVSLPFFYLRRERPDHSFHGDGRFALYLPAFLPGEELNGSFVFPYILNIPTIQGDSMKILLSGGGTGGHVNPALAIGEAIEKHDPAAEIHYVGTPGGIENRLVPGKMSPCTMWRYRD